LRRFLDDSDVDDLAVLAEDLHELRLSDAERQVAHMDLLVVVDLNAQVVVMGEIPRELNARGHHELHVILLTPERHHFVASLDVKLFLLRHFHSFLKKSKILF
jgi:hypothetical protein